MEQQLIQGGDSDEAPPASLTSPEHTPPASAIAIAALRGGDHSASLQVLHQETLAPQPAVSVHQLPVEYEPPVNAPLPQVARHARYGDPQLTLPLEWPTRPHPYDGEGRVSPRDMQSIGLLLRAVADHSCSSKTDWISGRSRHSRPEREEYSRGLTRYISVRCTAIKPLETQSKQTQPCSKANAFWRWLRDSTPVGTAGYAVY
jgi:hypothetical protein